MALERMGVKTFETEEIGSGARLSGYRTDENRRRVSEGKRGKKSPGKWKVTNTTVVKVGVCAAACAFFFVMKAVDFAPASELISGVRFAVSEEPDMSELLGKLQFVELPVVLSVFSGNDKMAIPVSAPYVSVDEESGFAEWDGAPNAQVVAVSAGEVRAIGEDALLGQYVRLMHSDELETIYYGLQTVQVEQGQPLRRNDTIGTLGEDGTLRMCVLRGGAPQSPNSYLNIVPK